jgi:hypothetical protein
MVNRKRTVFELSEHINLIITIKEKRKKNKEIKITHSPNSKIQWKHDQDRSKIDTPNTHDRSLTYLVQTLYKSGGVN